MDVCNALFGKALFVGARIVTLVYNLLIVWVVKSSCEI